MIHSCHNKFANLFEDFRNKFWDIIDEVIQNNSLNLLLEISDFAIFRNSLQSSCVICSGFR
jgi:hypothetical protein